MGNFWKTQSAQNLQEMCLQSVSVDVTTLNPTTNAPTTSSPSSSPTTSSPTTSAPTNDLEQFSSTIDLLLSSTDYFPTNPEGDSANSLNFINCLFVIIVYCLF